MTYEENRRNDENVVANNIQTEMWPRKLCLPKMSPDTSGSDTIVRPSQKLTSVVWRTGEYANTFSGVQQFITHAIAFSMSKSL